MNNGDKPATGGDWKFLQELNDHQTNSGLTKRELFAAMAMQGILANSNYKYTCEECAEPWVNIADALLKALEAE
jgi:hypothetical protein